MNGRAQALLRPLGTIFDRAVQAAFIVVVGVVLGLQYLKPNSRVIPVLVALLMFGVVWQLNMVTGLGVLIVALPFPRATQFGDTNMAFVLVLLVIWLLRASLGQSPPARRSPTDLPLVALFIVYVVSFYNVPDAAALDANLWSFRMMVASWLMFYLVASNIDRRQDFARVLQFQAVAVLLVCLLGVYESMNPGRTFIRGWIEFQGHYAEGVVESVRVGSVFLDYELLCEWCAMNVLLIAFLLVRATSTTRRVLYGGLLVLIVFVLFSTVTRGGLVALCVGVLYLLWIVRRRLTLVGVMVSAGAATALAVGMNWYVATFTHTGDLFGRLFGSRVRGLVPDTRSEVWPAAWERIFEHPLVGHGPSYFHFTGGRVYHWPHSLYLYVANNVGFLGLAIFLWLLWTLFRITRPGTDDLRHPDLVQAYMVIARAQLVVFLVDEVKIEFMRNEIYQFQVWLTFALMVAAHQILRREAFVAPAAGAAPARAPRPALSPRRGTGPA